MRDGANNTSKRFPAGVATFLLGLLACGLVVFALMGTGELGGNGAFKLRQVSVFDAGKENFLRGQMCRCQDKPFAEVRSYPAFTSQAPIFGSVRFAGRAGETNSGLLYYFAVDESRGTGKGYDRFYFDGNRDLDLRNDPVRDLLPQRSPGYAYAPHYAGIKAKAVFDFLKVSFSANGGGADTVEIMPRLLITGNEKLTYRYMFFVRTHLFEGNIRVAGRKFRAFLGNDYAIAADLNSPATALELDGGNNSFNWWGGDRISAIHKVDGRFFTFSATPSGELTVRPYQGDLGTFEIGSGPRKLTALAASGSLEAHDWAVPVGGDIKNGRLAEAARCQVPVGDYLPEILTIRFGHLNIEVSQNYHSDGKRQNRNGRPSVFGIAIRKDQPFVFDFPNKPDVMFASPASDQRVKAGDDLSVMAVLVDPKLDIMIRGLDDTSRKQTKGADGKPLGYERNLSLDPKVLITRANGDKVAEGVMPFG